jgi:hypothetical protein
MMILKNMAILVLFIFFLLSTIVPRRHEVPGGLGVLEYCGFGVDVMAFLSAVAGVLVWLDCRQHREPVGFRTLLVCAMLLITMFFVVTYA